MIILTRHFIDKSGESGLPSGTTRRTCFNNLQLLHRCNIDFP